MSRLRHRLPARGAAVVVPLLLALVVTASASGIAIIRIRPGDTLSAIAARYHTTVARLVALNHLPGNGDLIYAGQTLRVPAAAAPRSVSHWRTVTTTYVVRPGDSLYAISARFHADWRTIARVNHLPSSLVVIIGQRLRIPHRVHVVTGTGGTGSLFAGHGNPSRDTVAAVIRSTARHWGIDPRLALGISWQESGFQMRIVSRAGAVGAMQVMPSTGRFVGAYVVHRSLDLADVQDNVTAGVALLAVLLHETNGDVAKAVAGYYQGLASVDEHGLYADTKRYVANVLALRGRF